MGLDRRDLSEGRMDDGSEGAASNVGGDSRSFIITSSVHVIRRYRRYAGYQASKGEMPSPDRWRPTMHQGYESTASCQEPLRPGIWDGLTADERAKIAIQCLLQKNGRPEDIAWTALFLA